MDSTASGSGDLHAFLEDARTLLHKAQECVQHLELIHSDQDALLCLKHSLDTLAGNAELAPLKEVLDYCRLLQQLVAPACEQQTLHGKALPALADCLTLLAWQLELTDPLTGRLGMDQDEQHVLLGELAYQLDQAPPLPCASCDRNGNRCLHPHTPDAGANVTARSPERSQGNP